MKLKLVDEDITGKVQRHADTVACIAWIAGGTELLSFGDDGAMGRWSPAGEGRDLVPLVVEGPHAEVGSNSVYVLDVACAPSLGRAGSAAANSASSTNVDMYVLAGSDGRCYVCGGKGGRVERSFEAHRGGVTVVRWSQDGSGLLTAGEDGQVKIWSRNTMLRSVLAQSGTAVFAACWSPDADQVVFASGSQLTIKPLQPSQKPVQWKAHDDAAVLCVDWSPTNGLIVSSGEDRRYRVWDAYGRQLYSSAVHDHPFTALAWNPQGDLFAAGAYDTVRVCDKTGWLHAIGKPDSGSVFDLKWTADGTQLALAGGNGSVQCVHIVDRHLRWKSLEITLEDDNHVLVKNLAQSHNDHFEIGSRVVRAHIGFGHLILATSTHVYVYSVKNFNTPTILDLSPNARLVNIIQTHGYFCLVDTENGVRVFSHDGKLVSSPRWSGMKLETLGDGLISLSPEMVAIRDKMDERAVHLFDTATGRPIGEQPAIRHTLEITRIALDQTKGVNAIRQLALIDKNQDLFLVHAQGGGSTLARSASSSLVTTNTATAPRGLSCRLASMVDAMAWNEDNQMLSAIVDGQLHVWYYPTVVFVDHDLKEHTTTIGEVGNSSTGGRSSDAATNFRQGSIVGFYGVQCLVRRADGAIISVSGISPYPVVLMEVLRKKQWEEAVKLCRFIKSNNVWACLAAMSVQANELNTAEVAYAAIEEVDKVQHICAIKDIGTPEVRQAELALFRRNPKEAENIYLAAGQQLRCIRMWLDLFQWERALELAMKFKSNVDVVMYYRYRYLEAMRRKETNVKFIQAGHGLNVDSAAVLQRVKELS